MMKSRNQDKVNGRNPNETRMLMIMLYYDINHLCSYYNLMLIFQCYVKNVKSINGNDFTSMLSNQP